MLVTESFSWNYTSHGLAQQWKGRETKPNSKNTLAISLLIPWNYPVKNRCVTLHRMDLGNVPSLL